MRASAVSLLLTIATLLWGTSSAAQPGFEGRLLDPRSAFSEGQRVLSDPNATLSSKAAARDIVRAAGLTLGDATSLRALREAALVDACTAATQGARHAPAGQAQAAWKKVPAACGPGRAETVAAYAALARAAGAAGAHPWWARVLESYAASVPWSSSLTRGAAADDVAEAYLDMVDEKVQMLRSEVEQLPRHPFVDVFATHADSGAELRPGLAHALWDDIRGVQATLEPVRNLESPCGNASADQAVAALLDGLARALNRVSVPLYSQTSVLYLQQLSAGRATALTTPPKSADAPLPQFEEKRALQSSLAHAAMSLYASALLHAGDTCPVRVAPSRRGLAYLSESFQDWSACDRLRLAHAQCTEGAWTGVHGPTLEDPLPLPLPAPGG